MALFNGSNSIKLIYFDGRGVIENARIMLALGNVQYEDYRYPIDMVSPNIEIIIIIINIILVIIISIIIKFTIIIIINFIIANICPS